ncbi:PepSY domain-containing protein [Bacillus tianshenii]|uniref:PepSY domain-containing protein n=1 Tax=Sutcliffiella tianshenii TaxID=1463404 RepID=UPI001CD434D1|nr:PepSY domain-containing protein [Bacillus tianshenii]MCA1321758.1 PepSY domain-containing protein [Bacillus tianshenii]
MRSKWVVLAVLLLLIAGAASVYFLFFKETAALASEKEIQEIVETQYEGSTIQSISLKEPEYVVMIENEKGVYQIVIDGESREVTSLKRLKANADGTPPADGEPNPTDPPAETPPSEEAPPPTILTEQQAIEIALQEVSGKVDDIELDDEDGIRVYEVEIEVDEETEALVIINAYTGEILSLTWD